MFAQVFAQVQKAVKQVEKFKYLEVAFMSVGRQDEEFDFRSDKAKCCDATDKLKVKIAMLTRAQSIEFIIDCLMR